MRRPAIDNLQRSREWPSPATIRDMSTLPRRRLARPRLDATEDETLSFAREWVALAAEQGFEVAISEFDENREVAWSQELFEELTFDHFDDGRQPRITAPNAVAGLRVDAFEYNDGSGFAVDHDLALDDKRSDYTAQFDFRKAADGYRTVLESIHVL